MKHPRFFLRKRNNTAQNCAAADNFFLAQKNQRYLSRSWRCYQLFTRKPVDIKFICWSVFLYWKQPLKWRFKPICRPLPFFLQSEFLPCLVEQSMRFCSDSEVSVPVFLKVWPSRDPVAENDQHEPQWPWRQQRYINQRAADYFDNTLTIKVTALHACRRVISFSNSMWNSHVLCLYLDKFCSIKYGFNNGISLVLIHVSYWYRSI